MTSDPTPSKPRSRPESGASASPGDSRAGREARLAQALRANLRRRKAAPAQKDEKPGGGDSD